MLPLPKTVAAKSLYIYMYKLSLPKDVIIMA